jgi:hypothetical protein
MHLTGWRVEAAATAAGSFGDCWRLVKCEARAPAGACSALARPPAHSTPPAPRRGVRAPRMAEPLLNFSRLGAAAAAITAGAPITAAALHPRLLVRVGTRPSRPPAPVPRRPGSSPRDAPATCPHTPQACGTAAGTVHLLDFAGREWRRLQPHKGRVNDLAIDDVRRH